METGHNSSELSRVKSPISNATLRGARDNNSPALKNNDNNHFATSLCLKINAFQSKVLAEVERLCDQSDASEISKYVALVNPLILPYLVNHDNEEHNGEWYRLHNRNRYTRRSILPCSQCTRNHSKGARVVEYYIDAGDFDIPQSIRLCVRFGASGEPALDDPNVVHEITMGRAFYPNSDTTESNRPTGSMELHKVRPKSKEDMKKILDKHEIHIKLFIGCNEFCYYTRVEFFLSEAPSFKYSNILRKKIKIKPILRQKLPQRERSPSPERVEIENEQGFVEEKINF
ncbi:hypothetical protein WN51_04448 [Melipona quadrifasciata]|uniref:Uncharacterized protein n=1 Tax=Melipona quadrifasciata TaxID=166423 RepID=A0A0N0BD53_9HYME|nr:hypothetical protein WN51_04448 [Melipona quadrifasciata]